MRLFLPAELEDACTEDKLPVGPEWYAAVLNALADQLGVMNDFYYPLRGAATLLTPSKD